mmetsp:Transcript_46270/g.53328  ORF Transcript_46270/g.53328 Transcript_46270/m.53328 type:complete len:86 (-) Transcript_46270:294-551(-)|eukprot:CAMPEP_0114986390 /NCGR_PEP_ID=MMETSP0216-20121206/8398_1 /TAXON_ID=223996 /ORGANISM="Protocruzia adherens, Strain Boccale" /LENGTH=85 /DNA_ID=CAMNT_0002348817 /DNA_START=79 /DNA_END=336 /DNA_ORIENTATION=+
MEAGAALLIIVGLLCLVFLIVLLVCKFSKHGPIFERKMIILEKFSNLRPSDRKLRRLDGKKDKLEKQIKALQVDTTDDSEVVSRL